MEGKMMYGKGLETVSPSEMAAIRGGVNLQTIKRIAKAIADLASAIGEYLDDLVRGFKKGWDLINGSAQ